MTTTTAPPAKDLPSTAGEGYFHAHRGDLARRLRAAVSREDLKALHAKTGSRHLLLAARQFALYAACWWALLTFDQWWVWLPVGAFQGTVILSFIILLHDVVHEAVFTRRRPGIQRLLGLLYSVPCAISASQFTRWHLDHHKELGSPDRDPKRANLSPKVNSRVVKLLYMTPALIVIYARAANTAMREYPAALRRTITVERLTAIALHLAVATWLWTNLGAEVAIRAHLLPALLFFPIAFTINRLGQHYWIDPNDPAKWGTRVDGDPVIGFLFLNSHLHLEHHYFPGVPLYRLPRLNRLLRPFWDGIEHPSRSYRQLLHGWFVKNEVAHTNWD